MMAKSSERNGIYPVGIDLGTTYSSLAYLTQQGEPLTLPNAEGELSTPSVVLFDGDEVVVGTEALRQSVSLPERVVQFAKRHMGDPNKCWGFDGNVYRPKDISALILQKLLRDAQPHLGRIRHAVITVPAQFSELQRQDTVAAGLQAGLERVDIIHEPVAASLCYVLGDGLWYAELANEQTVLVFDLGGGTFDLSLVKYNKQHVRVLASGGDLHLGGLDWNQALAELACDQFVKSSISDPRLDLESMQALATEVEQTKRSLSVRPKSKLIVQHEGRRKAFHIDRDQFEVLTKSLLDRTEQVTRDLLKSNQLGWANVDTILATGGASRMPMIRNMLQRIGGTTLNQTLSPDQSISHGAAYYAGMLLSGKRLDGTVLNPQAAGRLANFKQQSVSGRSLGILVRDVDTHVRFPHYLLPANTPLPCAFRQRFGTVIPNQKRVELHIVESGASETDPYVELGECVIENLPDNLPVSSPIEVTIRYDEQARVHIDAVAVSSGLAARTTLVRQPVSTEAASENSAVPIHSKENTATKFEAGDPTHPKKTPSTAKKSPLPVAPVQRVPRTQPKSASKSPQPSVSVSKPSVSIEDSERPIPLCNHCGEALNAKGTCPVCPPKSVASQSPSQAKRSNPRQRRQQEELNVNTAPTEAMPIQSVNHSRNQKPERNPS